MLIAMQPVPAAARVGGALKHISTAVVPESAMRAIADRHVVADTEDAHRMVRAWKRKREEGYLVGVSSGANLSTAIDVARQLKQGVVVTIFCDSAAKYLSESFWTDSYYEAENWP